MSNFEQSLFPGNLNLIVGTGGEIVIKGTNNAGAPPMRLDVGDRLIGIGITHSIENLSQPPGPDSTHPLIGTSTTALAKCAARAFVAVTKTQTATGFDFTFAPLSPQDYSDTLASVSQGRVIIPPESIPDGTIIISFVHLEPTSYTIQPIAGSPGENWERALSGERYWNVGIASEKDFWAASFPSDDLSLLSQMPPSIRAGSIRFGLSHLSGGSQALGFEPVPHTHPTGEVTHHHFVLSGAVTGTQLVQTPFPILLRTEITCRPKRLQ